MRSFDNNFGRDERPDLVEEEEVGDEGNKSEDECA